METHPVLSPLSPESHAVLPLLYIAWADGILTPTEIALIKTRLHALDWLPPDDKATLSGWLDPTHPPSAHEYYAWIATIRSAARQIPDSASLSLAELGLEMARLAGAVTEGQQGPTDTLLALADIEETLGIVGREVARDLLAERPEEPAMLPQPAPFDIGQMTEWLDGPHGAFRHRLRTVLCDPVFRLDENLSTPAYRDRVLSWLSVLAEQGFGALSYPKSVGGRDALEQFIVTFEMLAFRDVSMTIKFGVQFGLFGGSIHQLGTERHHREYLPRIASLDLPGCFAMTELGHGSNVREVETVARFDAATDGFVIHTPTESARKEYIGNAAQHGQLATVFAQLEIGEQRYGVHAFLVPIRNKKGQPLPRIRIEDNGEKMGLNGVDNGRIWFDEVWIPRDNLLDRFAQVDADGTYSSPIPSSSRRFFTMLGTLVGGRISVGAAALSVAKTALTIAIRYGNRRRQFGPKNAPETPLLDYRTHQRRLLPLLAKTYALTFAFDDLRERFARRESEEDTRRVEVLAGGLKAYSTWHTTHTLQTAREACGGQGYLAVNRFAALKADTDIFTTFEGDNTVLMLQVSKGLLTEFKQAFHDINFFGLVKYASEQAATVLMELNPVVTRLSDASHLRDASFQLNAFRYREQSLLQSVAKRLKKRLGRGMDSYEAFIEVQNHLVDLAHAHVERVLLERFLEANQQCTYPDLLDALEALRSLFALAHLDQDRGWFLEHGYVEPGKARAIHKQVEALCLELRTLAGDLVDAFGIPDELLGAPIAIDA